MINLCDTSVHPLTRAVSDAAGTNLEHVARTILSGCGLDAGDAVTHPRMAKGMEGWLGDTSTEALEVACRGLGDVASRPCDPLGATLLRDVGVNPFALLAIERLMHLATNPGHVVRRGQVSLAHIALDRRAADGHVGGDGMDVVHVLIAPGIWWDGRTLSLDEGVLPATAMHAVAGRPLTEVLDLPGFAGVTITESVPTKVWTWQLRTDRRATPISWADALGMKETAA